MYNKRYQYHNTTLNPTIGSLNRSTVTVRRYMVIFKSHYW